MNVKTLLTSPLAVVSTLLTFLASLVGVLDPFAMTLWSSVPTLYPMLAISSSTILPKLSTVVVPHIGPVDPGALGQKMTLIGALIYVAYLGDRFIDNATSNTEN